MPGGTEERCRPLGELMDGSVRMELARLNRAIEARRFEIPIGAQFSLADAAKAHECLAAGRVLAKILLRVP